MAENLLRSISHKISQKSLSQSFLLIFKFSENYPKAYREFPENNRSRDSSTAFPAFYCFLKLLAAESIGYCQAIKLRESRAG